MTHPRGRRPLRAPGGVPWPACGGCAVAVRRRAGVKPLRKLRGQALRVDSGSSADLVPRRAKARPTGRVGPLGGDRTFGEVGRFPSGARHPKEHPMSNVFPITRPARHGEPWPDIITVVAWRDPVIERATGAVAT